MSVSSWLVYLLKCSDGSIYTGITNNLNRRMKAHASGKGSKYVRSRLPFVLGCTFPCKDKSEALTLEARIKKMRALDKANLFAGG